jgi:dolichol-phosphate mannosyltransferase
MNKFLRFVFVGIVAASVDLGTLWILSNFTGMNQYLAVTLGYTLGLFCNFYLSKVFTFKVKGNPFKQFLIFLIVSLINLLCTLVLIYGITHISNFSVVNARLLSLIITTPIVFVINKVITFRK